MRMTGMALRVIRNDGFLALYSGLSASLCRQVSCWAAATIAFTLVCSVLLLSSGFPCQPFGSVTLPVRVLQLLPAPFKAYSTDLTLRLCLASRTELCKLGQLAVSETERPFGHS